MYRCNTCTGFCFHLRFARICVDLVDCHTPGLLLEPRDTEVPECRPWDHNWPGPDTLQLDLCQKVTEKGSLQGPLSNSGMSSRWLVSDLILLEFQTTTFESNCDTTGTPGITMCVAACGQHNKWGFLMAFWLELRFMASFPTITFRDLKGVHIMVWHLWVTEKLANG